MTPPESYKGPSFVDVEEFDLEVFLCLLSPSFISNAGLQFPQLFSFLSEASIKRSRLTH